MTKAEFKACIAETRLKEKMVSCAYSVLVDGHTKKVSALSNGVSYESVRKAVARVERAHRSLVNVPSSWVTVTVNVPAYLEPEINGIADRAWLDFVSS